MTDQLRADVRDHYARAALAVLDGPGCCGAGAVGDAVFGPGLYPADELAPLPDDAVAASLGCGNPTAVADLRPGETVLDLGSGGGIDVLLAARRVAPGGTAYGLDMTDEMLTLARRTAAEAGVDNATFVKGEIEAIPLPDASVDVVISNCVINLSTDKPRVFAEIARVLRPGGRLGVSDVVADDRLTSADREERGDFVGCTAGALSFGEYATELANAGPGGDPADRDARGRRRALRGDHRRNETGLRAGRVPPGRERGRRSRASGGAGPAPGGRRRARRSLR